MPSDPELITEVVPQRALPVQRRLPGSLIMRNFVKSQEEQAQQEDHDNSKPRETKNTDIVLPDNYVADI